MKIFNMTRLIPISIILALLSVMVNAQDGILALDQVGSCSMGVLSSDFLQNTSITLQAIVVVNHPPLGMIDESDGSIIGFMPDAMNEIQRIALIEDNVTLQFNVTPVALNFSDNTFDKTLNMVAVDCDLSPEECSRFHLLIGSYWPSPGDRSLRTLFSPPLMETGYVTVRLGEKDDNDTSKRTVETLEQAQALNATVCLRSGDNSIVSNLKELYPYLQVDRTCNNHDECLENLDSKCALYVGHELVLRYLSTQRGGLAVNLEYKLPQQLISWAFHSRLSPRMQLYLSKWIYKAKQDGIIGRLFQQYFNPSFCPLGKAGKNCDEPCHPFYGESDLSGNCICVSPKWVGDDCSIEVEEDLNLIPDGFKITSWVHCGISFFVVVVCAAWLFAPIAVAFHPP